ncbi:MAG: sulfur carrier protein ThiS [Azospirillaceae bacterium]|nr:sulfur carrier protein ThiS [Azospirillaceae bacterium]
MTGAITISLNGKTMGVTAGTIAELIVALGMTLDRRGVAVAQNGQVVRRTVWGETPLQPDDDIEVVRALTGG